MKRQISKWVSSKLEKEQKYHFSIQSWEPNDDLLRDSSTLNKTQTGKHFKASKFHQKYTPRRVPFGTFMVCNKTLGQN